MPAGKPEGGNCLPALLYKQGLKVR